MEPALSAEARSLLASLRATLAELVEEGVDRIEADLATSAEPYVPPHAHPGAATGPRVSPEARPHAATARAGPRPSPQTASDEAAHKARALEAVRRELGECTRCALCEARSRIVFGDGNPNAALMFIGEGPGEEEDRRGLPFVGRAGELLTRMIERGLEIPRSEVYICNIVKCRPPGNRTPKPDEVASCKPFLDGQIDAVRPRTIVALGRPATSLLLGHDVSISKVRGTWHAYRGIPLMPTFHPAFLLRQYTAENRNAVWQDLKAALARSRE
ncbi:MAG TPA: uracil-DNA glycosylase [Myxococcota bacterium]|nr:uracil-DNA glycosylase [Myxococcota bacterium]